MKDQTRDFEQQLFLHRPEVYEKYMEDKKEKEALGYDDIVWKTPETKEEIELIFDAIKRSNETLQATKQAQESERDTEEDKGVSVEEDFLQKFEGIDLSRLGEDDG